MPATDLAPAAPAVAARLHDGAPGEPAERAWLHHELGPFSELAANRRAALARFAERAFPSRRDEEWRFTDPAVVVRAARRPAVFPDLSAPKFVAAVRDAVARHAHPGCHTVVFVDGFHVPMLMAVDELPPGVAIGGLSAPADEGSGARAAALLGLQPDVSAFGDLNTAFFGDAAWIRVSRQTRVERPLQVLFLSSAQESSRIAEAESGLPVAFPRLFVELEEGAEATILERHATVGEGLTVSIPWSQFRLADGAVLDHYRVEREGPQALHVAVQQSWLGRSASFSSHSFNLGAALARQDVQCFLQGEGGDAILNGLYLVTEQRHVDTQMRVEHVAAHCNSHELYKGVLDGKARAVFNGRIYVHPGAQKTDAKQTNRNLLLSREALVNTNPQLEIFADDVRCTHGSTVGQLDADAVFYLRSRGIGEAAAKSLLTWAFASDVVERVRFTPLRKELEEVLFAWLPMGEVVRDAV